VGGPACRCCPLPETEQSRERAVVVYPEVPVLLAVSSILEIETSWMRIDDVLGPRTVDLLDVVMLCIQVEMSWHSGNFMHSVSRWMEGNK
jgi:hypothetical protein